MGVLLWVWFVWEGLVISQSSTIGVLVDGDEGGLLGGVGG